MKSLRSPLGRVVGLGSAKGGVHHWWLQRLTSVALVPLTLWFAISLLSLPSFEHATLIAWMAQSWTALLLILLVLVSAYHSQLGVQVVVEDYIHDRGMKTLILVIVTFVHGLLAAAGVFAILKVSFGGAS
jgi:succinate dehydrogenase / fumarate reductase membrane anchor subunit